MTKQQPKHKYKKHNKKTQNKAKWSEPTHIQN